MATTKKATEQDEDVYQEFKKLVNMTARQIETHLETEESKAVGWKNEGDSESIGHASGRKIVEILGKKKADVDEEDEKHLHKVVAYIKRHLAQKPDGDIKDTNWRYSLMNWGHDPLKEK